jgi:hypothetical protein
MRRLIAIGLFVLMGCAHAQQRDEEWRFLMPGEYHGVDAPGNPGDGWLALAPMDGLWHLVPTEVVAELIHDPVSDSEGQKTGIQISTQQPNAFAFFRMPGLRAGKIDTPNMRFHGNPRDITPSKGVIIPFKGVAHQVVVVVDEVVLVRGFKRSKLAELRVTPHLEDTANLLWAGDLDGDGRLDLLVGYGGSNKSGACLFLSSFAQNGALLGEANCHGGVGC